MGATVILLVMFMLTWPQPVVLPPGSFLLTTPDGHVTHVTLSRGVVMDDRVVNRGEFLRFVDETGHDAMAPVVADQQPWWTRGRHAAHASWPADEVSFRDALAFANWRSDEDGLDPVYDLDADPPRWRREADGWRLPTEAEWTYGAGCGDGCLVSGITDRVTAADLAPMNDLGLRGMLDGALEWCWDGYVAAFPDSMTDPVGEDPSGRRVVRGLGLAEREWAAEDFRGVDVGFRLVRWSDGVAGLDSLRARQRFMTASRRHRWQVEAVSDSLLWADWDRRDEVRRTGNAVSALGLLAAAVGWTLSEDEDASETIQEFGKDLAVVGLGVTGVGGVIYLAAGKDLPRDEAEQQARQILGNSRRRPPPLEVGVTLRF